MKKIHFHSLDALRFFAFLAIYFLHIPTDKEFQFFSYLTAIGGNGVSFFFVLSGFLISYLLLIEKSQKTQVNVRNFLIRRSLRIWPLFFLIVIIVLLLPLAFKQNIGLHMVGGGYEMDWRYSFTFLENYKMLIEDNFPKTTPLSVFWSLCIEEHFYLLWLCMFFIIPMRHLLKFFICCIFISWLARFIEPLIFHNSMIVTNDLFTNLDFFSFGAVLAYLVANHQEWLSKGMNKLKPWWQFFIVVSIFGFILFQNKLLPSSLDSKFHYFYVFRPSIIAILFTIIIAFFVIKDSKMIIRSKVLNYLGTISFGLYVYHLIFIHLLLQYFLRHQILIDNWQKLTVFIFITLSATVLCSVCSYHFFEKPVLLLRDKFTER